MKLTENEIIDAATNHCKQFDSHYQDQSYSDFYEGAQWANWAISQMQPEWVEIDQGGLIHGASYILAENDSVYSSFYRYMAGNTPYFYSVNSKHQLSLNEVTHFMLKPQPPTK